MKLYWLLLGTLAVWRITHLATAEDGPWDLVARLRRRAALSVGGRLLECFYCLSLWVSLPVSVMLAEGWKETLLTWPAVSAGAILVERLTRVRETTAIASYREDQEGREEERDVLLP